MRKGLLITAILAATAVTATVASPSLQLPLRLGSFDVAASMMTNTAVKVSLLFVWIIAAVVLTLASAREVRYSSIEIRTAPLHCLALGLVAVTSFVLTAILFSYLIPYLVGLPLLVALGLFALIAKISGMIAIFHSIGTLVAGARSRDELAQRRWLRGDLAMVLIGVLLLGAIRLIPIAGTIVWSIASVFAIGTALATKFGRREPWFLTWRPAEV